MWRVPNGCRSRVMKYAIRIPVRVAVADDVTSPSMWSWQDEHTILYEEAQTPKEAVKKAVERVAGSKHSLPLCTYAVFDMHGSCEGEVLQRYGRKDAKAGDVDPHPFCGRHWSIHQEGSVIDVSSFDAVEDLNTGELHISEPPPARKEKWRASYVPAPHFYNLNQACHLINKAFASYGFGTYLVGSSCERRDYRDVDVRYIMDDASYDRMFRSQDGWYNSLWSLMCTSISLWLSKQSDLPIDFQIQRQTQANEKHSGQRQALGIFLDYPGERPSDVMKDEP